MRPKRISTSKLIENRLQPQSTIARMEGNKSSWGGEWEGLRPFLRALAYSDRFSFQFDIISDFLKYKRVEFLRYYKMWRKKHPRRSPRVVPDAGPQTEPRLSTSQFVPLRKEEEAAPAVEVKLESEEGMEERVGMGEGGAVGSQFLLLPKEEEEEKEAEPAVIVKGEELDLCNEEEEGGVDIDGADPEGEMNVEDEDEDWVQAAAANKTVVVKMELDLPHENEAEDAEGSSLPSTPSKPEIRSQSQARIKSTENEANSVAGGAPITGASSAASSRVAFYAEGSHAIPKSGLQTSSSYTTLPNFRRRPLLSQEAHADDQEEKPKPTTATPSAKSRKKVTKKKNLLGGGSYLDQRVRPYRCKVPNCSMTSWYRTTWANHMTSCWARYNGGVGESAAETVVEIAETPSPPAPSESEQAVPSSCNEASSDAVDGHGPPTGDGVATLRGKRKISEESEELEADLGPMAKKKTAPQPAPVFPLPLKPAFPFFLKLNVEDIISSSATPRDCCVQIDVQKWEQIITLCNSKSVILLPEGTFSFPPGYDFKSHDPGLTISGKDPNSTSLCLQHQDRDGSKGNMWIALDIRSALTLKNLSVKNHDTKERGWPTVTLADNGCRVYNVNFIGCSLLLVSNSNVVENCSFSSHIGLDGEPFRLGNFKAPGVAFGGGKNCCGNVVKNLSFRNLSCGIHKRESFIDSEPDTISNLMFRNVNIGVCMVECNGDTVTDVTYQWDKDKIDDAANGASAVEIVGGERNTVDGIHCKVEGLTCSAFCVRPQKCSAQGNIIESRGNTIRNVTGAEWRYDDRGLDTQLFNVEGKKGDWN